MATTYIQTYEVSLVPNKLPKPVVNVSQSDSFGRKLNFHLCEALEYETGYDYYWFLQGTKPNGLGFKIQGSYTGSTQLASFNVMDGLTECSGVFEAEISIQRLPSRAVSPTTEKIGTANILINVEQSPHPSDVHDDTAEKLKDKIEELLERATEAVETTEINAQTTTTNAKNASTSEQNAATSASTASKSLEEIKEYYSQMVTEKISGFIDDGTPVGSGGIDWEQSEVYRTGDRIHGYITLTGSASGKYTLTYSEEVYKPISSSVVGTLVKNDTNTQSTYRINEQTTLVVNSTGTSLTLLLDYVIATVNTYENGDELEY